MLSITKKQKPIKADSQLSICTFYCYRSIPKLTLNSIKTNLLNSKYASCIRGLILLSPEGINAALAGSKCHLKKYILFIQNQTHIPIKAQWQPSHLWGFKHLRIKIKNEIVQTGQSGLPIPPQTSRLTPSEWKKALKSPSTVMLDIRNDYEFQVGRFKDAQHFQLKKFKDFPARLKKSSLSKESDILIYCTGGVRCEKALSEMKNQGFQQVRQLQGGILNFLSQFPNTDFKGECFVFDRRAALDQTLLPSKKYKLCPHCGQAGNKKIQCVHCQADCVVCAGCHNQKTYYQTCSKNCAYHYRKGHPCKKRHRIRL